MLRWLTVLTFTMLFVLGCARHEKFGSYGCKSSGDYGFAGGGGTDSDPYLICNADQLDEIRNHLDKSFKLTADINLSGVDFEPLGSLTDYFTGRLDGDGHTIENWTYTSSELGLGLFTAIVGADVYSLTLKNFNLNGTYVVGALTSTFHNGLINKVAIRDSNITAIATAGGVAGVFTSGTAANIYVDSNVAVTTTGEAADNLVPIWGAGADFNGQNRAMIGGLFGSISGTTTVLSTSYSAASINFNSTYSVDVGEALGYTTYSSGDSTRFYNVYYLDDTSITDSTSATLGFSSLTASEMQAQSNFENFNFNTIWTMGSGSYLYPIHQNLSGVNYLIVGVSADSCYPSNDSFAFSGGSGTESDPLHITSPDDLISLDDCEGSYAKLTTDITLPDQFLPLETTPFYLDGNGKTISNWNYTSDYSTGGDYFGLFKKASVNSTISNLNLVIEDLTPTSGDITYFGGLVGYSYSGTSFENISITINGDLYTETPDGNNTTTGYMGGMVGYNQGAVSSTTLTVASSATIQSEGKMNTGGLIGSHEGSTEIDITVSFNGSLSCTDGAGDYDGNCGGAIGELDAGTLLATSSFTLSSTGSLSSELWNLGGLLGVCSTGVNTTGYCAGTATIEGSMTAGDWLYMGGYAGQATNGILRNATALISSSGSMTSNNGGYMGALMGHSKNSSSIESTSSAEVAGTMAMNAAGYIGWMLGGNEDSSSATYSTSALSTSSGSPTVTKENAGGVPVAVDVSVQVGREGF